METTLITGNTYPVRFALHQLGGKWDGKAKGWRVPADKAVEARTLVASAPKRDFSRDRAPRSTAYADARRHHERYQSNHYRFAGGGEMYVNKAGRCIDSPACGCCSPY